MTKGGPISCCAWAFEGPVTDTLVQLAEIGLGSVDVRPSTLRGAEARAWCATWGWMSAASPSPTRCPPGPPSTRRRPGPSRPPWRTCWGGWTRPPTSAPPHAYVVPDAPLDGDSLKRYAEVLPGLADYARAAGARLCVEHFPGTALPTVAGDPELPRGTSATTTSTCSSTSATRRCRASIPAGVLSEAGSAPRLRPSRRQRRRRRPAPGPDRRGCRAATPWPPSSRPCGASATTVRSAWRDEPQPAGRGRRRPAQLRPRRRSARLMRISDRHQRLLRRTFLDYQHHDAFAENPLIVARAEGLHYWDVEGRRYLDGIAGVYAATLGHGHPRVVEAVTKQLERPPLRPAHARHRRRHPRLRRAHGLGDPREPRLRQVLLGRLRVDGGGDQVRTPVLPPERPPREVQVRQPLPRLSRRHPRGHGRQRHGAPQVALRAGAGGVPQGLPAHPLPGPLRELGGVQPLRRAAGGGRHRPRGPGDGGPA